MSFLSFHNKLWCKSSRLRAGLSLVMLFGDLERWLAFARFRFQEVLDAGIFKEVVFVVNHEDYRTRQAVIEDIERYFWRLPVFVIFRSENNIPAGRNAGVKVARTQHVFVWDDDDSCDPRALSRAYQAYVSGHFPVLELPLAHPDGRPFHPQPPESLPQVTIEARGVLVMGMVHTPFFTRRDLLVRNPIPEHVALRGDWLHWSTRLWRLGIPILSLYGERVATEAVRPRDLSATASARATDFSSFHAFLSLLFLFVEYRMRRDSFEACVVRRRYFDKYCPSDHIWDLLVRTSDALRVGQDPKTLLTEGAQQTSYPAFHRAQAHVVAVMRGESRIHFPRSAKYDVAPFGLFQRPFDQLYEVLRTHGLIQ